MENDSSDLKIQVYNKKQQENQENLENNLLQREKLEEEFYDFFKKEQQELERKRIEEEKKQQEHEDNLEQENEEIESEDDDIENDSKQYMEKIIILMQEGKSRHEAAKQVGVSSTMVDDWFNRGLNRENGDYFNFYLKVYKIEKTHGNDNSRYKKIKCKNCGKYMDLDSKFCFFCGFPVNSTKNSNINFCENCGTKLENNHLNYCIECGHPISRTENNVKSNSSTKHQNGGTKGSSFNNSSHNSQNNFDFKSCCIIIFIIYIVYAIISAII